MPSDLLSPRVGTMVVWRSVVVQVTRYRLAAISLCLEGFESAKNTGTAILCSCCHRRTQQSSLRASVTLPCPVPFFYSSPPIQSLTPFPPGPAVGTSSYSVELLTSSLSVNYSAVDSLRDGRRGGAAAGFIRLSGGIMESLSACVHYRLARPYYLMHTFCALI